MNTCINCGKPIGDGFKRCKECYMLWKRRQEKIKEKESKKEIEQIILFKYKGKPIEFPLWLLGIIFLAGVIAGAWLW